MKVLRKLEQFPKWALASSPNSLQFIFLKEHRMISLKTWIGSRYSPTQNLQWKQIPITHFPVKSLCRNRRLHRGAFLSSLLSCSPIMIMPHSSLPFPPTCPPAPPRLRERVVRAVLFQPLLFTEESPNYVTLYLNPTLYVAHTYTHEYTSIYTRIS